MLKDKGGQTQSGSSTQGERAGGGEASGSAKPGGAKADPKPTEYKGVNLTAGYHLTLGDEDVRPQKGEDGGGASTPGQ
ncbi:hypothetical protein ABZZ20_21535 [Streptomyces sp. NPDC006430]|uniref:hypothetical protein n=1 Tax=Streptomyces sp. NPDC006430 TaxID=3154299 RepID=UPI0033ADEF2F